MLLVELGYELTIFAVIVDVVVVVVAAAAVIVVEVVHNVSVYIYTWHSTAGQLVRQVILKQNTVVDVLLVSYKSCLSIVVRQFPTRNYY